MPLRVSSNWSSDLLNMKMAQNGQHIKTKKPSRPELYQDAARILEELLTKQLEDPRPRPLQWRHRSAPLASQRVHAQGLTGSELQELKGQRSNTLPSRTRLLVGRDAKERGVSSLERKAATVDSGSASSADTEGDSSSVSEKRRKKTVFRKARDRLLHAFHRQAREKNAVQKDGEKDSKSPTKEKTVSPKCKQNDKSAGQSVRVENSYGNQLPQTDLDKRRSSGKSLMDSIRKSLRLSKKKEKVCPTEGSSVDGSSKTATSQGSPDSLTLHSLQPAAQSQADRDQTEGLHTVSLTPAGYTDQGLAVSPAHNSPSPFPQSTSTDSYHDSGNKSSSLHSIASTHGALSIVTRNALDNPEEDILYMDDEARTRSRHGSGVQLGGDKRSSVIYFQIRPPVVTVDSGYSNNGPGSLVSPPPPPQEGIVMSSWKPGVHNKDGKPLDALVHVDSLEEDGDTKDGADVDYAAGYTPFNQRTQEEKEELYSKIAKKLSLIADRYTAESGPSDSDTRHKTGQQEADGLTDLEKEIIACLRDKGDKLSQKVDEPAERMIEQTKAQTYEQFKRTIQHSLGSEVSWNHLAFLFYTTRGVVSAVGRSSDVAAEVTEMTLKYFSDKFASWIIDQGGFESVLTESESELD